MAFVFGDYTIEIYKNLKTRLRCYDCEYGDDDPFTGDGGDEITGD